MTVDQFTESLLQECESILRSLNSSRPSPTPSEPQPPEQPTEDHHDCGVTGNIPSPEPQPPQKPTPIPLDQRPVGVYLDQLPTIPTDWLWPHRLPLAKLTLLDAAPGCGASLFALTLAAHVSSGTPWPDGTPCLQGNVLLITPYDGLLDTLVPRLQAAGADLSHIILHNYNLDSACPINNHLSACTFPRDLHFLETTIKRHHARLVIIDPASAIPGLPKALPDLAFLAARTHCTLLLTRSLDKPPADPLHAHGPTSPLLTAARSHLLLAPDPADERKHLLLTPKHSLCAAPAILSYEITATDQDIPAIHWLGERTTSDLTRLSTGPLHSPQRQAILHFLRQSLTPQTIKVILAATSYDHEAGRKMLLRMKHAGELISPAPGLYTTPNHPCLAQHTANNPPSPSTTPEVNPSDQPEEPVPVVPCPQGGPVLTTEPGTEPEEPVPVVPCPQSEPPTPPSSTSLQPPPLTNGTSTLSPPPETPTVSHANNHTPSVPDVPPVPSLNSDNCTNEFPSAIIPPTPPQFPWTPLLGRPPQPFPTDDSIANIPIPHLVETT